MGVTEETKIIVLNILHDVLPYLDEKDSRILEGSAAKHLGYGGIAEISKNFHVARNTISSGIKTIETEEAPVSSNNTKKRIRKEGGGRKKIIDLHPELIRIVEQIISESTFGSPETTLHWTCLSLRKIASIVYEKTGILISQNIVSYILDILGYSKQLNQKMLQVGEQHPDRDEQFKYINDKTDDFLSHNLPVISVDTKKKENIGNFKNNGAEYRPIYDPQRVFDHDFPIKELGKVAPYGVYVLNNNTGFVNVGVSHDTPDFAGNSIFLWWEIIGKSTFPNATKIYINCDGGGSNNCRSWLWKQNLQEFANKTGLEIHVSHFPPGTSKWNKIEHRLFCYISKNWQGKPLIDIETVVNLISNTTTTKGLTVKCNVDHQHYELGKKISNDEKDKINIEFITIPNKDWNYIIRPND